MPSLADLAEWWTESLAATAAPRTITIYREAVDDLAAWLIKTGGPTSKPPDRAVLEMYIGYLRTRVSERTGRKLSASYVNQRWRSLQQFYKFLESEGLSDNPFARMKQPTIPESPVPVFTDDELKTMFVATKGVDVRSRRDRVVVRLLLDTGCRVGELAGMRVSDIDFSTKTVLVTGKASRSRHVPFNAKAYTELRRWLLSRPETDSDALLVGIAGRHTGVPITESGVRQILDRLGVQNPHPHRFRHTAAHLWLKNGGLEVDLRRLMGWRSESMVYRYAASAGVDRALTSHHRLALADQY